ncbi:TetR/AcrR family transcriptional regulator [Nonomuraea typhae]|uniref:TetR/AcrR family transcriptional regulator n=1 Tax=Nonomuraea typhae TaxID=2603600 RepID=UPI0012F977E2|nr:TetR/AcrR family transcriptional regulator C-terminal domain-containing protein [Nonomuraea typhae]
MAAGSKIENLLWEQPPPTRPSLSLPTIATAAIAIADADGIDAVSMQRVAGDLGFTKMSLYRYVSSKSDLVAVMIERAVGDPPDLSAVQGWRPKLEELARLVAEVWARHPWLPWVTMGDRMMGPREIGWSEAAVGALAGTGLTGGERLDAALLLFGHLRNTQSLATAGTQPWAEDRGASPALAQLLDRHASRFPSLVDALADAKDAPADSGRAFGLACVLDGLAARINARAS